MLTNPSQIDHLFPSETPKWSTLTMLKGSEKLLTNGNKLGKLPSTSAESFTIRIRQTLSAARLVLFTALSWTSPLITKTMR